MHREVRSHPPPSPPSGLSGVETMLMERIHLPPSIPVSKDGEEGALAYHFGLLQSNAELRPERYHAPPNRTVDRRDGDFCLSFHHSTSTTKVLSISSCSSCGTGDSKTPSQCDASHSELTNIDGKLSCDSSTLTLNIEKSESQQQQLMTLKGCTELISDAAAGDDGDRGTMTRGWNEEKDARSTTVQKQRSSSAEGVRRIINKYSFLRNFTRRHASPKAASSSAAATALHPSPKVPPPLPPAGTQVRGLVGVADVLSGEEEEAGSPSGQMPAPWELPPNYVDMIFIKDPMTSVAGEKDEDAVARKQHKLKPQQQLLQQHLFEQQQKK